MTTPRLASIDPTSLLKGQSIAGPRVWDHYVVRRPESLSAWIEEHGSEEAAYLARHQQVLLKVRDWLDRDRHQLGLPPLVINTVGGRLNILTDEQASSYLNDQAYQGLRKHQRSTVRLLNSVDEDQLSSSAKRAHQNRINVHSFIAASAQGAQRQLRLLRRAGKPAPRLEG